LSWYPLRAEAAASGDLGWSIGHGTFSIEDGGNVQRFYSKYLTVWIRTADGWRFLLDGRNPRPAP
jgi:ketosteroid isomerase-like protein